MSMGPDRSEPTGKSFLEAAYTYVYGCSAPGLKDYSLHVVLYEGRAHTAATSD